MTWTPLSDARLSPYTLPAIRGLRPPVSEDRPSGPYAAVGLLFVPPQAADEEDACLVLTVRSHEVATHRGQVSLAGGYGEPEDDTVAATAAREAEEEIGLPAGSVQVHGQLPPRRSRSGHPVWPVVMTAPLPDGGFRPSPQEVAEMLLVPWPQLRPERNQPFTYQYLGGSWRSDQFFFRGFSIWGLTADIVMRAALAPGGP